MKWFGPSWSAPVCAPENHRDTPAFARCARCAQSITEADQGVLVPYGLEEEFDESDLKPYLIFVKAEKQMYIIFHNSCFVTALI